MASRLTLGLGIMAGCGWLAAPPAGADETAAPGRVDEPAQVQKEPSPEKTGTDVRITLGEPRQVMHFHDPDAMGLFNVPDMHTAVLRQGDRSYLLWITGNIGPYGGAVARLSTEDFLHYQNAGPGTPTRAEPVLTPSFRAPAQPRARNARRAHRPNGEADEAGREEGNPQSCDADYAGANAVIPARNGKDLLMIYEAGNKTLGDTHVTHGWEYNVIALARSTDRGLTWKREGVILTGSDPKPTIQTGVSQPGVSEPGALVADGYLYVFFQYVPNQNSDPDAPSVIQVARAPVSTDGAPGTWMKYFEGSFSQPGIGGRGSRIVATGEGTGCTRPVQIWPAFSTYLNAYVLAFLGNEGWFFSTSTDLLAWSKPVNFLPMTMWQPRQAMDWNFILVTPGNEAGVLGQTGYVLYAHTGAKGKGNPNGFSPHMLWVRPFAFSRTR